MSHRTGISGGHKGVIFTYSPGRMQMNRHKDTLLGPYFANGSFSKDDSFQPLRDYYPKYQITPKQAYTQWEIMENGRKQPVRHTILCKGLLVWARES